MSKERYPLYGLTPMNNNLGIGFRITEIVFQTIGLIVFRPIIGVINLVFFGTPKRAR